MTIKDREEKQQLDTYIECEELLDTSILDDVDGPTDSDLDEIEIEDNLIEDVYNLVDEINDYLGDFS